MKDPSFYLQWETKRTTAVTETITDMFSRGKGLETCLKGEIQQLDHELSICISYNCISRNEHSLKCSGSVTIAGESREGLASILSSRCSICHHTITFATAEKVKGPHGYSRWECILAAVWGQMTTGGGHSQLEETMIVLGVPVMTSSMTP